MVSVTEATAMGGCRKRTALCSILLLLPHLQRNKQLQLQQLLIIISPLALVLTTQIKYNYNY